MFESSLLYLIFKHPHAEVGPIRMLKSNVLSHAKITGHPIRASVEVFKHQVYLTSFLMSGDDKGRIMEEEGRIL